MECVRTVRSVFLCVSLIGCIACSDSGVNRGTDGAVDLGGRDAGEDAAADTAVDALAWANRGAPAIPAS
ncbi:MAG: hypothetical protein AAF938_13690 [Myxococcota bacterium]